MINIISETRLSFFYSMSKSAYLQIAIVNSILNGIKYIIVIKLQKKVCQIPISEKKDLIFKH